MSEYIAFDSHKRYTWVDRQDHSGNTFCHRLEHAPGAVRRYWSGREPGTPVAVEATGNWYWIVEEIEQAGLHPARARQRRESAYGPLRNDVNRYLKWAFAEAANSVAVNHCRHPDWHVSRLYARVHQHKGHPKAIGAVARHLAEAAFHVLRRKQAYRDPELSRLYPTGVSANLS